MSAHQLLRQAQAAGMTVVRDGDQLRVRRPNTAQADRVLDALKQNKPAVLAALRVRECGHGVTPCGTPGRLYPCGWRCDEHSPGAVRRRQTQPLQGEDRDHHGRD